MTPTHQKARTAYNGKTQGRPAICPHQEGRLKEAGKGSETGALKGLSDRCNDNEPTQKGCRNKTEMQVRGKQAYVVPDKKDA
jgi:hypothetical protein